MRVKIFVGLLVALVVGTLAALAFVTSQRSSPRVVPAHDVQTLGSFRSIEISGLAEIKLRQGSTEAVAIDVGARGTPRVHSEISNGTLTITAVQGRRWSDWFSRGSGAHVPQVTIDFIDVSRIEAAGAVKLSADRIHADALHLELAGACSMRIDDLQAATLAFEGSGAINAHLAGKVNSQEIDISGAGTYDAGGLVTERSAVQLSGAGKAIVNAKTSLRVDLSGAAVVEYLGDPRVEQQLSGISKIRRRDAP